MYVWNTDYLAARWNFGFHLDETELEMEQKVEFNEGLHPRKLTGKGSLGRDEGMGYLDKGIR